jgi:hypothetical protein
MIRAIYVLTNGIVFFAKTNKKIELKICCVVLKYLYTMSDYDVTIHAISQIPFVKDLRKKNKRLRREIKALKNLIYSLPEFRCRCIESTTVEHNVKIKTEPGLEPTPCDTLADGDDVVYVEKSRETENIVYVIDDHEVDVHVTRIHTEIQKASDMAQASEAQASKEEEEEEAGEAEAQAGEDEEDEDGEVYEITIAGKAYYTTNGQNGKIYAIDADEEVGDEIGVFVNGKATFHKKK